MIFIYSGEVPVLDRRLRYELGANHRLLTIPDAPEGRWAALEAKDYFQSCGLNAHALSKRAYGNKQQLRDEIFTSDAVYLSGGNTYRFLAYAREIGLFSMLQTFESLGGIIAAESAGSIILSSNISTAAIPTTCPDENNVGVTEFNGMGRVPFHVSPHFVPDATSAAGEMVELQHLANLSGTPVLILPDGAGVVVQEDEIIFSVGSPAWVDAVSDRSPNEALSGRAPDQSSSNGQSLAG